MIKSFSDLNISKLFDNINRVRKITKSILLFFSFMIFNTTFCLNEQRGQAKIDSLLYELPKSKEDTNKVNLLNQLCLEYFKINPEEGIKFGEQGLQSAKALNWNKGIANTLLRLGMSHSAISNYPKALEHYDKSLKIYEGLDDNIGITSVLGYIGIVYKSLGDYSRALEYYNKALSLNEKLKDKEGIAKNFGWIGLVKCCLGELPIALEYNFKALKMYEELDDKSGIAGNLLLIGYYYKIQSDYAKALEYYFKSLNIFTELGEKRGIEQGLAGIGDLYFSLSEDSILSKINRKSNLISFSKEANLKTGFEFTLKAVEISKEIGNLKELINLYNNLYYAYKRHGNYSKALEFHELFKDIKDSVFNLEKLKRISEIETKRKNDLKEKEIEILNKDKESQVIILNFLIGISFLGIIFSIWIFYFYRQKKKDNKILEEKNKIISKANNELDYLNLALTTKNQEIEIINNNLSVSNAAKDKFFSIIAHDLKNPLTAMITGSDLLFNYYKKFDDDQRLNYIEKLTESSRFLFKMLENLLQWARSQTNKIEFNPEQNSINDIISENINLLKLNLNDKKINIIYDSEIDLLIKFDINMMNTVIRNLLTNAIKFSNEGGSITVKIIHDNKEVQISIMDNGVGIPESNLLKLFRIDSTLTTSGTKNEKGTGLGLILCKEFVEIHHGRIWVQSYEGKGTTFFFTLPI